MVIPILVSSRVHTEQELNIATENEKRLEEELNELRIKFDDSYMSV